MVGYGSLAATVGGAGSVDLLVIYEVYYYL